VLAWLQVWLPVLVLVLVRVLVRALVRAWSLAQAWVCVPARRQARRLLLPPHRQGVKRVSR
jgi:hypothetical protein